MRILMTTDTLGGVWTYAVDLLTALRGRGVTAALATMGRRLSRHQQRQIAPLPHVQVFQSDYPLEWMDGDPWPGVDRAGQWLLETARQFQPDLVHLNHYGHGHLPWEAPALVVGHSCVLSWWQAVKGEPAPPRYAEYARRAGRGLRAADAVAAPTAAMLAELERLYGPLPGSRVIHNGRRQDRFSPADKQRIVLSAGRVWDEAKNLAALNDVAAGLPWPVLVAGQEPDQSPELHVQGLGWLGPAQLARWMRRAAVYAEPAYYEPFGLSALEAGLSGCALVLGDIPSLREVWGQAATFVPPADRDALDRALRRLLGDDAHRREMGRRARQRARQYTLTAFADGYMDLYRELLAGRTETRTPAPRTSDGERTARP
ncbi:MAG: glycosyltransferase family 4 protein [Planctomycetota bacterium]